MAAENAPDEVCPAHGVEHQPRDHSVPCAECGRPTFDVHRLCEAHLHRLEFEVAKT